MLKEERQTWILNKLHSSGKVVVSHLAGELKVSEDTIRRGPVRSGTRKDS